MAVAQERLSVLEEYADAHHRLGDTHLAAGDPDAARAAWRQALSTLDELGHPDAGQVRRSWRAWPAVGTVSGCPSRPR